MKARPLMPGQPVTFKGDPGSPELLEVIQRIVRVTNDNDAVLAGQQAAIPDAAGGTEVATINAILAALRAHGLIAP